MRVITISAITLLALAFIPIPSEVTPNASVKVIDETGAPVSGVSVYRSWEHFGLHQHGHQEKNTNVGGVAAFSREAAWDCALTRSLSPLLSIISPLISTGARTHFDTYCPVGYELRLADTDYALVGRTGDYANYRNRSGEYLFLDYRPPQPTATSQYSVRICLDYDRRDRIDFTLPIRRVQR